MDCRSPFLWTSGIPLGNMTVWGYTALQAQPFEVLRMLRHGRVDDGQAFVASSALVQASTMVNILDERLFSSCPGIGLFT